MSQETYTSETILDKYSYFHKRFKEVTLLQLAHGYHCRKHMEIVAWLAGEFCREEGLPEEEATVVVIAALLHDLGHTGQPDTVRDETDSYSLNIFNAISGVRDFATLFTKLNWGKIESLIRATEWPHKHIPFLDLASQVLRDADVCSSLHPVSTTILLNGLRQEYLSGGKKFPSGAGQLKAHIEFFKTYRPYTKAGERFFNLHFFPAQDRWFGFLLARDGGHINDYIEVLQNGLMEED